MTSNIIRADYNNPKHAKDIITLLNSYATDPMGGGTPISEHVRTHLIDKLKSCSTAFSIIAYVGDQPAGLANCFEGFSTFKCAPLINIHDMAVHPNYKGQGLSQKIMAKIEDIGHDIGACKITLEVLSGNIIAQNAYKKFGFSDYELDPEKGHALFWEKTIS
ncbi:MAG: GNAT family N-acetyltransferase [Micavibrio sp.]|nr:GNAT family N-acetyltransferase [Micavibrio sp.]